MVGGLNLPNTTVATSPLESALGGLPAGCCPAPLVPPVGAGAFAFATGACAGLAPNLLRPGFCPLNFPGFPLDGSCLFWSSSPSPLPFFLPSRN